MGELFRWEQPASALAWTGERFVNGIGGNGQIEIEHLHRYFLAREFCRGKSVLDVASGEGYGSALLAQTAERVLGVEIDLVSVEHASRAYPASNLRFVQGNSTSLPVAAASMDVVVSFETLEHFSGHEVFYAEVKRVLKPNGLLVLSTPDVSVYSGARSAPNPYHVRELTDSEFVAGLRATFFNVVLLRQRVIVGSTIWADPPMPSNPDAWVFERRNDSTFEAAKQLQRAPYLLAVASNSDMGSVIGASVYVHTDHLPPSSDQILAARNEADGYLKNFRDLENSYRKQSGHLEDAARQVAEVNRQAAEEAVKLTEATCQVQEQALKLAEATREIDTLQQREQNSERRIQQQELVLRRLQRDVALRMKSGLEVERLESELAAVKQELAKFSVAYNEICNLIIPVRIRRGVPGPFRSILRAVKRVVRHG